MALAGDALTNFSSMRSVIVIELTIQSFFRSVYFLWAMVSSFVKLSMPRLRTILGNKGWTPNHTFSGTPHTLTLDLDSELQSQKLDPKP